MRMFLTTVLALAGCVTHFAESKRHVIQRGDMLRLTMTDKLGPPVDTVKDVCVDEDGTIPMQFIGRVPVAGLTEPEVVRRILEDYVDSTVLISVDITCEYIGRCK